MAKCGLSHLIGSRTGRIRREQKIVLQQAPVQSISFIVVSEQYRSLDFLANAPACEKETELRQKARLTNVLKGREFPQKPGNLGQNQ